MTTRLDDAIDQVAARMTAVKEDDGLALRIASSLPARSGWSLHWLMPRLAVGALAAFTLAAVLMPFDDRSTDVPRTDGGMANLPIVEVPSDKHRTVVEPSSTVRRTTVERPSNERGTTVDADHAFSLAAIEPPDALSLSPLTPSELAPEALVALEPLVIAHLPLTAELSNKEE